ncbi:HAD family hydrolase [Candidatus Neomarinimicrobiota bacterium]
MISRRKLILFDIDGTLLSSAPTGRESLEEALTEYLGWTIHLDFHDVAGFTDPAIIEGVLQRNGYNISSNGHVVDQVLARYLDILDERIPGSGVVTVFRGAIELVAGCRQEGWCTALLTGNVERGARVKLGEAGIWDLFDFGIYGDEGNLREDLPWLARERAWDEVQESFRLENIFLVGDTPNDARVARLSNIHSLIVNRRPELEWRQAILDEHPGLLVDSLESVGDLIGWIRSME